MFIIELTYTKSLNEVDNLLQDHIKWLEKNYKEGNFIASGRKNPRVGGVILTVTMDRDKLDLILQEDPFNALANYSILEFIPSKTIDKLEFLKSI